MAEVSKMRLDTVGQLLEETVDDIPVEELVSSSEDYTKNSYGEALEPLFEEYQDYQEGGFQW